MKQKAYALISTVVIITIIIAIVFYLADALFSEMAISRNQKSATTAFYLADAGIQEAIWRIKNDDETKNTFLHTSNGRTFFPHDPGLLNQGSYDVTIQNTAVATATITSIGYYDMGIKKAQRRIKVNVVKATTAPPYDYTGAIFTSGSVGNEDISLGGVDLTLTGSIWVEQTDEFGNKIMVEQPAGSLMSARNIEFNDSDINVIEDIKANNNITIHSSSVTQGGVRQDHAGMTLNMPMFDSAAYRTIAANHHQLFADDTALFAAGNTFDGVVYVDKTITIDKDNSLTINGLLISGESITIGSNSSPKKGTLTVNHSEGNPAGVVALHSLNIKPSAVVNIEGITYVGDQVAIEKWDSATPATRTINFKGGLLCRRLSATGLENSQTRIVNIVFNRDWINEALGNPNDAPVIVTQHWEEEY